MLNQLLAALSKRKSTDTVFNQYQDEGPRNNLKLYFKYLLRNKCDILLIGEAPGYKGCRLTGIPFTSETVIKKAQHKMFRELGSGIKLCSRNKAFSENTATIFWDFFGTDKQIPILWNAFPFHPHKEGKPESNRRPNSSEIEEGREYLKMVYNLFQPKKLCSIGCVGEHILNNLFPNEKIIYIRHPSFGGKKEFEKGIRAVLH